MPERLIFRFFPVLLNIVLNTEDKDKNHWLILSYLGGMRAFLFIVQFFYV